VSIFAPAPPNRLLGAFGEASGDVLRARTIGGRQPFLRGATLYFYLVEGEKIKEEKVVFPCLSDHLLENKGRLFSPLYDMSFLSNTVFYQIYLIIISC
jgi:hypothetical protein